MENKIALVIGGSRGIGRAIALRLAKSGFNMWITYNSNSKAAEEVKSKIQNLGRKCETLCFDVSNYDKTKEILSLKLKKNTPEVVVYNSGIAKDNLLAFMEKDEWDSVIKVNLNGFYNVMKPIVFEMLAKKRGRIIIISSTSGETGQAGQVNYSASKAGLIGAAKALAREVGRKNIFVNVVSPGVIDTEMTTELPKEKVLPLIPLKRYGKPEEVASLVNFLATEEHMYIHGQVIGINGGLSM
jgi:3-oxoacyl-[acyl-carrier protein] reductase